MNRYLTIELKSVCSSVFFKGKCQDGYSLKEILEYLVEYYNTVSKGVKK